MSKNRSSSGPVFFAVVSACCFLLVSTSAGHDAHRQATCLEQCRAAVTGVEGMLVKQSPAVASTWRTYLGTAHLLEQLDRGPDADPQVIAALCSRFDKPPAGADRAEIAKLKAALLAWNEQLRHDAWPELFVRANEAADAFQPVDAAAVAAAHKHCQLQLTQLDQALRAEGEAGTAWRTWLLWPNVQAAVMQNKPEKLPGSRAALWREAQQQWNSPALTAADAAIATWQQKIVCLQGEDSADSCRQRLTDLQEQYAQWHQKPSAERFAVLINSVMDLEDRGFAPELTQSFRRLHSQPNLLIRASRGFIERESRTDLGDSFPIAETIAGAAVSGTGNYKGNAMLQLIPTERAASLDVNFIANVTSRTSSNTQGVQIDTHSSTQVSAKKRLTVNGLGMRVAPTQTTAVSQIFLDNLDAGGPVRQRFAMAEYTAAQPAAKRDSEARTAHYVSTELDTQVTKLQQRLTQGDENPFLKSLVAYRPNLPRWWRTTSRGIEGRFWAAGPEHFAASTPPPFAVSQTGIAIQTHESFVERTLAAELSSKTILSHELPKKLSGIFGRDAAKQTITDDEDPWELSFAEQPVGIKFDGNLARLTLFITGFKAERGEFPGLQIRTTYRIAREGSQVKLARSEIEVVPIDYLKENPVPLSGRQQMLSRMVQRLFERQMPPDIDLPGLKPTKENRLKAPLDFVRAETAGGWLTLVLEAGK